MDTLVFDKTLGSQSNHAGGSQTRMGLVKFKESGWRSHRENEVTQNFPGL